MGWLRIVLGAGLAFLLAACAIMDYQLEPRAGVINHQTDNARNNEILLNIVRASYSQPLNFVPISKTSGTQTTDLKVGLPTFTLGPAQTIAQKQFQLAGNTWDNSSNGSFDSAPLASHDFYANMMSPIALETASALIHMGYSRELVLNTVIAAIRVEGGGQINEYRNDPFGEPEAAVCPDANGSVALDKKGPTTNQQSLKVIFRNGKRSSVELTFTIIIRSTFSAFSYFGHVLRSAATTPVRLYWPDRNITPNSSWDMQILAVSRASAAGCFAATYLNGEVFCVPSDAGDTTKQVFAMLSQLVALNTTTGSLPTTLEVRLQ